MIAAFVRKKFAANTTSVGGLALVPREDRSTGCYLYLGPLGNPVFVRPRRLFHNFNLVFSPGLQRQNWRVSASSSRFCFFHLYNCSGY
jgi:hypothetical protein